MQKIFIEKGLMDKDMCPIANRIGENGFYLPSGPQISSEELNFVVNSIKNIINDVRF